VELVEIPARHFHDHIVERGFEVSRSGFGDLVFQLIQRVADGEFGRDFGDGVARRFAGQRGGARHPRVDLDGDKFFVSGFWANCTLQPPAKLPSARMIRMAWLRMS
jgi:hypothetical protein